MANREMISKAPSGLAQSLELQATLLRTAAAFWAQAATLQQDALMTFRTPTRTENAADDQPPLPFFQVHAPRVPAGKLPIRFEDVTVGTESVYTREIRDSDVQAFALASGDVNPIHLDESFARTTFFNGRIAHGILTAGLISAALSAFPGTVVYVAQDLRFLKPVRPGDVLTARAKVEERLGQKAKFRLRTTCENQDGELVLDGAATILLLPPSDGA